MMKRYLAALRLPYYINKRSYILVGAVLVLVALCGAIALALSSSDEELPAETRPYVAASEVRGDAAAEDSLTGIVQSSTPLQASSVEGGRVVQLLAQIGDRVTAGTPLAVLDRTGAALRVKQAQGDVDRAAEIAAERASAAARAAELVATGTVSEAEQSAIKAEARAAAAALRAARAGLGLAEDAAAQRIVRAPGSGVVASRNIEVGGVAAPGQILFELEGRGGHQILAAVPQKLAGRIMAGLRVRYSSDNGGGEAQVIGVSPRVEDGGVVPVRLAILSGQPMPGAIVQLTMTVASSRSAVVRVPATAIQVERNGGRFIYRIGNNGRILRVPVTLLDLVGSDARVTANLPIGARVVEAGGAFIRPGQRVLIAKPGT